MKRAVLIAAMAVAALPLCAEGVAKFGYANQRRGGVESLRFRGEGKVESLEGSYRLYKDVFFRVY